MKRYIKPDIETIRMASTLLLSGSKEEGSQVEEAMSKRHNFDYDSGIGESTSGWLKSDSFWDDGK